MLKVKVCQLPVRGYHAYERKLAEKLKRGEELKLYIETERFQETSTFPVAVRRCNGDTIGHLPKECSWCFKMIIRNESAKIMALVKSETPVTSNRYGEEIICDFAILGSDSPNIRYALDNLCEIIKEPNWKYGTSMVQITMEDNKQVIRDWSCTEDTEDQLDKGDIPEELDNNPLTRSLYEKAIAEGEEEDKSIRIMVIGCYGQGKTSLVMELLGEKDKGVPSTNGVDVINFDILEDDTWKRTGDIDAVTDTAKRIAKVNYPGNDLDKKNDYKDKQRKEKQEVMSSVLYTPTKSRNVSKKRKTEACHSDNTERKTPVSSSDYDMGQLPSSCSSDQSIYEKYSSEMNECSRKDTTKEALSGSIWDFGGQYIFYSTHQLFHSRQAIYLLVFDLSLDLERIIKDEDFPNKNNEKTLKDYLQFWVSSVHSFVGSQNGEEPYIILVGTHIDKVDPMQDVDECFENVRKIFDGTKQINHIHHQHFAVSNIQHGSEEIWRLRKEIRKLGEQLAKKRATIPARWILLENMLRENQHEKITTFDQILAVNNKMQFPLAEESQVKLFLQFHHARGSLFYFNDSELSKYVILDTQYLIDAFRCIITSRKFCITNLKFRNAWEMLCDEAFLEDNLVAELWGKNPERNFLQHKKILLGFLQRHRILSPMVEDREKSTSYYIVPSLLKAKYLAQHVSSFINGKMSTCVRLVYEFDSHCIVDTIFHRFTAAALGLWQAVLFRQQRLLFENLSVFEIPHDHAGLVFFKDDKLELLVVNMCPPEKVCSEVCDSFRRTFESIVSFEFQKLHFGEESFPSGGILQADSVRCYHDTHGLDGSENVHLMKKIKTSKKSSICCPDNESHRLVIKDIDRVWYNSGIDLETVPKRELTRQECGILATAIGKGWDLLAMELTLSTVSIEHIEEDFVRTSRRILEVLNMWQQDQQENATLYTLVKAILKLDLTINEDKLKNIIDGLR